MVQYKYVYVLVDPANNATDVPLASQQQCGDETAQTDFPLRVAAVFVILVGSLCGALFPVLARRTKSVSRRLPKRVFDTAKYFGSGVIIGTAFIHLLSPAIDELSSPCLGPGWQEYPYALALALISIFSIFIVELVALRWGTAKLASMGVEAHSAHSHSHSPADSESDVNTLAFQKDFAPQLQAGDEAIVVEKVKHNPPPPPDLEHGHNHDRAHSEATAAAAQLVGIAILEFGVLLHSFLIGLTLAVTDGFKVLFIVLCIHQTFEGLGVGSRLAFLEFPSADGKPTRFEKWVPVWCAVVFGLTTPLGIAIGLGFRSTYDPASGTASIVSGVLDAFSAGVLIYTGLVELLAHDFLFNAAVTAPPSPGKAGEGRMGNGELAYAVVCVMAGCGGMAVLGRWA